MLRTEWSSVGDLRALVWRPDDAVAGVVLVDGSGPGACDEWGGWAERIADLGVVVLAHDRPGCGGSPGDFLSQTMEDRAVETRAALAQLRKTAPGPVGLLGVSQGGWVGMLAADRADFLVSVSAGVGPAEQERYRIGYDLRAAGLADDEVADGLAWVDERTARLIAGEDPGAVHADQRTRSDRPWYAAGTASFDSPEMLAYAARMFAFDPAPVLPGIRCPALALFGAADGLVPVPASVAAWIAGLPDLAGLAVFPGADHGLFLAEPAPGVDRTSQLAPGFLPMLGAFLRSVG